MRHGYGQYCPLALAAELLCERWTLLVVSRLIDGCSQFNEIHRGVPRISPDLVVEAPRSARASRTDHSQCRAPRLAAYLLADAGGARAGADHRNARGVGTTLGPRHDPRRSRSRVSRLEHAPAHGCGAHAATTHGARVRIHGCAARPAPVLAGKRERRIDMCLKHPGYEIDLHIDADLRLFIEAWRGIRDLRREIHAHRIRLTGPSDLRRKFPQWLKLSSLAPYPRKLAGRESRLLRRSPTTGSRSDEMMAAPAP